MLLMGKSTISMVIFNSDVTNYQRVDTIDESIGFGKKNDSQQKREKTHEHTKLRVNKHFCLLMTVFVHLVF